MVALSGGDKLEAALKKIAANVTKAATVEIGFPEGATYADGTSVPMVAALNEFGHGKTPPRPFFRTMISAKSGEWPSQIADDLKNNDYDAFKSLGHIGQIVANQLQQSIVDFSSPALSPITVMLRGMRGQKRYRGLAFYKLKNIAADRVSKGQTNYGASTKALVDTGQMLKEVKFVVK